MDKIDKTTENYVSIIDDNETEGIDKLLKDMVDKINEIIDWINSQ
tara:strand:- start:1015 stop:1149 length:135 start_codon:yes stop_codon:yes gene_type:complete